MQKSIDCRKLTKERDELADDNAKLQIEVMHWQDEWYKSKVALKNLRKQMIYPKRRSQRIKESSSDRHHRC